MPKTYGDDVRETLQHGKIENLTVIPEGSNGTYLVTLTTEIHSCMAIYKPSEEEKPLWDFPSGTLYKREYASYLVATALGWNIIPPTVIRGGPLGEGSIQLFLQLETHSNYFTLRELYLRNFQTIALFDYITNNADRKASHCTRDLNGRIWCIDHGLTFHSENKLRTVIWDFEGEAVPRQLLHPVTVCLEALTSTSPLAKDLLSLLTLDEFTALISRIGRILQTQRFPILDPNRFNIPWPWL